MSTNSVIQFLENQFLHWRQDMKRKQEEQARQMKELQGNVHACNGRMTSCWPRLRKTMVLEKMYEIANRVALPTAFNKEKEPVVPDDVDTPVDDELSSGNSYFLVSH